jgi:hypothetical protein
VNGGARFALFAQHHMDQIGVYVCTCVCVCVCVCVRARTCQRERERERERESCRRYTARFLPLCTCASILTRSLVDTTDLHQTPVECLREKFPGTPVQECRCVWPTSLLALLNTDGWFFYALFSVIFILEETFSAALASETRWPRCRCVTGVKRCVFDSVQIQFFLSPPMSVTGTHTLSHSTHASIRIRRLSFLLSEAQP